jgi:hypothetical protein
MTPKNIDKGKGKVKESKPSTPKPDKEKKRGASAHPKAPHLVLDRLQLPNAKLLLSK